MARLTQDMTDSSATPYFLWNEPTTVEELRRIVNDREDPGRAVYMGRLLREARVQDVWHFLTPEQVATEWEQISPFLGRKREFWKYLLDVWRKHGKLP